MKVVPVSRLFGVAVVVGVAGWAILDVRERAGAASVPVSAISPVVLVVLALLVLLSARRVRRWVNDPRSASMSSLTAARIGVLAAAAAYVGAATLGWYLAQALVLLPDLVGDRSTRFVLALITAAAAGFLAAAGVIGQRWCRLPPSDHEDAVGRARDEIGEGPSAEEGQLSSRIGRDPREVPPSR